jgi:four helix bundle protein
LPIADCRLPIVIIGKRFLKLGDIADRSIYDTGRIENADSEVCIALLKSGGIVAEVARAATSVAANYRAACRARSKAEFIAKLGIVEEEADEVAFWLELTIEAEALPEAKLNLLLLETEELLRIIAASRISAARNVKTRRQLPTAANS